MGGMWFSFYFQIYICVCVQCIRVYTRALREHSSGDRRERVRENVDKTKRGKDEREREKKRARLKEINGSPEDD